MKVIYSIPHVTLSLIEDKTFVLRIEDTELFDTFENILMEQFDIVDLFHSTETKGRLTIYSLYFNKDINETQLLAAVKSIDQKEVERIYRMNNSDGNKTTR